MLHFYFSKTIEIFHIILNFMLYFVLHFILYLQTAEIPDNCQMLYELKLHHLTLDFAFQDLLQQQRLFHVKVMGNGHQGLCVCL